jgi:transposase
MKEKDFERLELKEEELRGDLERVRAALGEDVYRRFKYIVDTLLLLTRLLKAKRTTVKRLKKLIFGSRSEKTRRVLKKGTEEKEEESEAANGGEGSLSEDPEAKAQEENAEGDREDGQKKRGKGHGRNGAEKYVGAETIEVSHESLRPGDPCPTVNCEGRVYRQAEPRVLVHIVGQAPIHGTVIRLERLRCSLCLTIFTAKAPEGVSEEKYDVTAVAMMAILRYGSGFPLYRLEKLEEALGIPLPDATQWDVVSKASPTFVPVEEELIRQAAQGEVVHNDDTGMKILQFMTENRERRERGETVDRTGMFTSGIVSVREEIRIALFFTGREHAGENLSRVLAERDKELGKAIQMCDALSRNVSREFETIVCNCLSHARRQYVDVVEDFPTECRFVLETLREVFKNDATARREKMAPEERLTYHRRKSMRLMAALRLWAWKQLRDRLVEPNSELGKAIGYMRKHWRKLTRFLFVPGAPIHNNLVERILKRAILHRRYPEFEIILS